MMFDLRDDPSTGKSRKFVRKTELDSFLFFLALSYFRSKKFFLRIILFGQVNEIKSSSEIQSL